MRCKTTFKILYGPTIEQITASTCLMIVRKKFLLIIQSISNFRFRITFSSKTAKLQLLVFQHHDKHSSFEDNSVSFKYLAPNERESCVLMIEFLLI